MALAAAPSGAQKNMVGGMLLKATSNFPWGSAAAFNKLADEATDAMMQLGYNEVLTLMKSKQQLHEKIDEVVANLTMTPSTTSPTLGAASCGREASETCAPKLAADAAADGIAPAWSVASAAPPKRGKKGKKGPRTRSGSDGAGAGGSK